MTDAHFAFLNGLAGLVLGCLFIWTILKNM